MKIKTQFVICILLLFTSYIFSQNKSKADFKLEGVNVSFAQQKLKGQKVIRVVKDSTILKFDEPTFVKINNIKFSNGIIEVKVLSRLLPNAPDFSRGFIGIAFHINEDNSQFECIYLRPTNARAESQIRRNHSIQYFAYPEYKFQKLREEYPCAYETYADLTLNEWISLRLVINGEKARLYINNNKQPSLVINDLKFYNNHESTMGLFVDVGTEAFFKDLKIHTSD